MIPKAPTIPGLTQAKIQAILVDERLKAMQSDYKDGRLVFPSMDLPDGRFKHIHAYHHRIMSRFVHEVEAQVRPKFPE